MHKTAEKMISRLSSGCRLAATLPGMMAAIHGSGEPRYYCFGRVGKPHSAPARGLCWGGGGRACTVGSEVAGCGLGRTFKEGQYCECSSRECVMVIRCGFMGCLYP